MTNEYGLVLIVWITNGTLKTYQRLMTINDKDWRPMNNDERQMIND